MIAIGNIFLAIAFCVWNFTRSAAGARHAWLDALCGLLFGISIGINLFALRIARRCREKQI